MKKGVAGFNAYANRFGDLQSEIYVVGGIRIHLEIPQAQQLDMAGETDVQVDVVEQAGKLKGYVWILVLDRSSVGSQASRAL